MDGERMPSRPSLDWRNHDFFDGARRGSYGLPAAEHDEPWPIPSREAMQKRFAFRQGIREETLQHRRIHKHGGMGETGRNICLVLCDREVRGASGVALRRHASFRKVESHAAIENYINEGSEGSFVSQKHASNRKGSESTSLNNFSLQKPNCCTRVCYPTKISHEVQLFAEYYSVVRYHSAFFQHLGGDDEQGEGGERPPSSKAVSTISIAFSPDSQTMASTHGDHTVKITCCSSGRLLQTLEGHPRTPWTVKYHPIDSALLASGCLGHQVRLWHWPDKVCLQMIRLEFAIISLSFHPTGNLLAVANGTRLHFWGFNEKLNSTVDTATGLTGSSVARNSRGILTEVDQRHMLRCVHFPPEGNSIIIGGVNPTTDDPRRRRGGIGGNGMSFYLRLWDFDIGAVLQAFDDNTSSGRRRAISNPRTFVPRALLYNDGGFDVSPDGKELCACAEYWLPEGVNSAMELVQDDDQNDNSEDEEIHLEGVEDLVSNSKATTQAERDGASTPTQPEVKDDDRAVISTPPNGRGADDPRTPVRYSTPTPQSTSGNDFCSSSHEVAPQTPPRGNRPRLALSPPSPPGRRFSGGVNRGGALPGSAANSTSHRIQPLLSTPTSNQPSGPGPIPPPPPPPPGITSRQPHPLSIISGGANYDDVLNKKGRYVPHVVTVSLDTTPMANTAEAQRGMMKLTPVARGYRPRLGQLLEASPLDGAKASAVTCVKFSPSTDFCLIGYGVREPVVEGGGHFHPVTALYRVRGGMTHLSTMLSGDDDVNIARFHPDSGYGFVYGTKQGRVRVLSPRPWNFYS